MFLTMSGFSFTFEPKTKNVAFTFSFFNVSNIVGVTEDGPSSNVKYAILSSDLYIFSIFCLPCLC